MNDYVKKSAVIKAIDTATSCSLSYDAKIEMLNIIKCLPFATGLCGVWVSADDPPGSEDRVICQTRTKKGVVNMVIGYHDGERWCCGMNSNVEAWTPLPEEYEPEK